MELIRIFLEASVGVLRILAIWLLITVAVVLIIMLSIYIIEAITYEAKRIAGKNGE